LLQGPITTGTTGAGDGVGVAVEVGVDVGLGEGVGVGVAVTVGFGAATVTPLFQTSFFPFLMQVYFLPTEVEVAPSFEQEAPAFTAAIAFSGTRKSATVTNTASSFFM